MSSGWPPEDDDRRWEQARHPSAVGAVHDSRGAERGYSGLADYEAEGQYPEGQYPGQQYASEQYAEGQYAEGQYADGQEGNWYGAAETSYPPADYQPQPDNAGYGEVSYPEVYDLSAPADGGFPQQGYGPYGRPGYGRRGLHRAPQLPEPARAAVLRRPGGRRLRDQRVPERVWRPGLRPGRVPAARARAG